MVDVVSRDLVTSFLASNFPCSSSLFKSQLGNGAGNHDVVCKTSAKEHGLPEAFSGVKWPSLSAEVQNALSQQSDEGKPRLWVTAQRICMFCIKSQ